MFSTTLTSKGQATIPKEVREALGLRPRDKVRFRFEGKDRVVIERHTSRIEEVQGSLKHLAHKGLPTKEQIANAWVEAYHSRGSED